MIAKPNENDLTPTKSNENDKTATKRSESDGDTNRSERVRAAALDFYPRLCGGKMTGRKRRWRERVWWRRWR
ncbi:hypothetical protein E2C01_086547 [Portunus trituberculatus]|uniref:Uncharacterized protein n=1 Tax=Portunus trituberculatus TaxID=210409 RepID=A0A5B7JDS0_PORTR|nr:hypothetical protein [Portunus trituberculatus]